MLLIVAVMVPLRLLAVVFAALARVTQVGLPVNARVIAAALGRQAPGLARSAVALPRVMGS